MGALRQEAETLKNGKWVLYSPRQTHRARIAGIYPRVLSIQILSLGVFVHVTRMFVNPCDITIFVWDLVLTIRGWFFSLNRGIIDEQFGSHVPKSTTFPELIDNCLYMYLLISPWKSNTWTWHSNLTFSWQLNFKLTIYTSLAIKTRINRGGYNFKVRSLSQLFSKLFLNPFVFLNSI